MDLTIKSNIDELIVDLKKSGINTDDPVSKLMINALLHQAQKIKDEISDIPSKVADRLCTCFIPKDKLDAMPALCFLQLSIKNKKGIEAHEIIDGTYFTYNKTAVKTSLCYYPLYRNCIIPYSTVHLLTSGFLISKGACVELNLHKNGHVWLGLEVPVEIETLQSVSFYIKGTRGVLPERICAGENLTELSFTTADNISDIPVMEPFDCQQVNPSSIEMISNWKSILANPDDGRLLYITETLSDRDIFRSKTYPKSFQHLLESNDLDKFGNNTLWLLFDFGDDYEVPEDIEIIPNVVPAVNVHINTATLTQSSPIEKLTKSDGSYFLNVIENSLQAQKRGFNTLNDEIIIRDFDNSCYNPDILYRDVRNLYNRFVDDYHAFICYHNLKDGELIRSLRELVNNIGKSVTANQEIKNRYDEGTYAMRKIGTSGQSLSVKVSYLTTFGRLGNSPKNGELMENKKDAAIEKDVRVISSAKGGEDKANADQRYELLRYYTLTSDRLFTKMDIDAFLRMQLLKEFGKDEVRRINYNISIQGAGGPGKLVRGLYIDIRFKDDKNYRKALGVNLDRKMQQMITDKSCISMPVHVSLFNTDIL